MIVIIFLLLIGDILISMKYKGELMQFRQNKAVQTVTTEMQIPAGGTP